MSNKLTVINLRGTSGCGKTTIVRNILDHGEWQKWEKDNRILAYFNETNKWSIIGSYENTCGGCDTIKTQDDVESRIQMFIDNGYSVIFEGLIISTITERWAKLAKRNSNKANFLFYYIDTPIDECIERVQKRRLQSGNLKPFNTKNTTERVKSIESTFEKLSSQGLYCLKDSQKNIIDNLFNWFGLGGII